MIGEHNITLNEIAYNIFESVRGKIGDDDNIATDQIKDMVHSTRARLLKQKFDKNIRIIDNVFTQSLGAIEVGEIDSSIFPDLPSNRWLFRTLREIPETIDRRNSEGTFTRIGPAERRSTKFNLVTYERAIWSGNGRFNRRENFVFLLDNRIHVISNSMYHKPIQYIDVIGVFQNPAQVALFKDQNGDSLYSDDMAYPISRSMIDDLQNIIIRDRLMQQAQVPSDVVNDSTDTLDPAEARD